MHFLPLFFALVFAHFVGDYPLQGDFLAAAKNHQKPVAGVPWILGLASHAVIQGGLVALVTGSAWIGVAEASLHGAIDAAKNEGLLGPGERGYAIDQVLHIACKVAWVAVVAWV